MLTARRIPPCTGRVTRKPCLNNEPFADHGFRVRRRTHTRAAASGLDEVARLMADARKQLLAERDVVG